MLYHLDAYRLENAQEAEALDMDWMLDSGALVVEWPERIKSALPTDCLWVNLRYVDDLQRGMVFKFEGSRYETLLAEFRRQAFGG
jgi:tRNA A37 threonylcarbamoyladenosine biosynthesis protein TsaE